MRFSSNDDLARSRAGDGGAAMVPRRRLELPRPCGHWYLKPARLPIPPPGRRSRCGRVRPERRVGRGGGWGCQPALRSLLRDPEIAQRPARIFVAAAQRFTIVANGCGAIAE